MSRSPTVSATRSAICAAEVGQVVPVAAAVEHALGVVHLAVPDQVDDRRLAVVSVTRGLPGAAAAAAAAGRASSTV